MNETGAEKRRKKGLNMLYAMLLAFVAPYFPADLSTVTDLLVCKSGEPLTVTLEPPLPSHSIERDGKTVYEALPGSKFFAKASGGTSFCGMYEYTWLKNGIPVKREVAVASYLPVYPNGGSRGIYNCKATDFSKD